MKLITSTFLLVLIAILFLGCASNTATIRFLKNTKLQIPHLPGEGRVEGRDCVYRFLTFSFGTPRIDLAIADSLKARENHYNGLADAEVFYSNKPVLHSLLGGTDCLVVTGRPVLVAKPAKPEGLYEIERDKMNLPNIDWDF